MYKNLKNRQEAIQIIPAFITVVIFAITSFEKSFENFQKGNYILALTFVVVIFVVVIVIYRWLRTPPGGIDISGSEFEPIKKKDLLYGRDDETEEILTVLKGSDNTSLIILSGLSGCGKSSLIRAGVIPYLDNNFPWVYLTQYDNFKKEIINGIKKHCPNIDNIKSETKLHLLVDNLSERGIIPVLIFDQFEQLYMEGPASQVRREVIDSIKEVLEKNKKVKVIISVRDEAFKEIVTSFNGNRGEDKPCWPFYCQYMKIINIGLLSHINAKRVLKEDLKRQGNECNDTFCNEVVTDLIGIWQKGVLPVTLRIVSKMIATKKPEPIKNFNQYKDNGRAKGLQQRYLSSLLDNIENRDVVPQIIFSLCDSARGSVTLSSGILAQIAQKDKEVIDHALIELKEKKLIYETPGKNNRVIHEYLGKLLQESGTRVISPIEREELNMRREVFFSKGDYGLRNLKIIKPNPSIRLVKWVNLILSTCIILLVLRYIGLVPFSSNWFDSNFVPVLIVGIGSAVLGHHYFLYLLSRLREIDIFFGIFWSYIMLIISLPATVVIIWQPDWWPFVLAGLTWTGAIKDWQLALISKEKSPELFNTFRSWRNSMFTIGFALIIVGLALYVIKESSVTFSEQSLAFAIELGFAAILGFYFFISAIRFYSMKGLRPIISLFNLEVVGSLKDNHR